MKSHIKVFPIKNILLGFKKDNFRSDLKAGINESLLAFPQVMAYALIAGLPIEYGIYGAVIASFIGSFFASSKFIVAGPTNASAVMLLSVFGALSLFSEEAKIAALPLLLIMVGLILIVGAYLKLANLIQYVSRSVIAGYITAAALLIIVNQVPSILGVDFSEKAPNADTFAQSIVNLFTYSSSINYTPIIISLISLIVYFGFKYFAKKLPTVALTLITMSVIGYFLKEFNHLDFKTLSAVNLGQWKLTLPSFSFNDVGNMFSGAVAIALLSVLEGMSIGKSLAAKAGTKINANQEMYGLGMANLFCGLFSSMGASGSLTRSALSFESGAKTTLSALFSSLFVVLIVLVLGEYIAYIPSATLAVLLIFIGISLINRHTIKIIMNTTSSDKIVFLTTFIVGLFAPLVTAIYTGIIISVLLFIRKVSAPEMVEYAFDGEGKLNELEPKKEVSNQQVSILHVEGELFFGATEIFYDQIRELCQNKNLKVIILKMRNAHNLDATSIMALEELVNVMKQDGKRYIYISEARDDLMEILTKSGLAKLIGEDKIFKLDKTNPTLSTALALRSASKYLNEEDVKVKIQVGNKTV